MCERKLSKSLQHLGTFDKLVVLLRKCGGGDVGRVNLVLASGKKKVRNQQTGTIEVLF